MKAHCTGQSKGATERKLWLLSAAADFVLLACLLKDCSKFQCDPMARTNLEASFYCAITITVLMFIFTYRWCWCPTYLRMYCTVSRLQPGSAGLKV